MLPLFFPELALESARNPFDVLAMTFFPQKVVGRTWKGLHKGSTCDPHEVLGLILEMMELNMSATSPS